MFAQFFLKIDEWSNLELKKSNKLQFGTEVVLY